MEEPEDNKPQDDEEENGDDKDTSSTEMFQDLMDEQLDKEDDED